MDDLLLIHQFINKYWQEYVKPIYGKMDSEDTHDFKELANEFVSRDKVISNAFGIKPEYNDNDRVHKLMHKMLFAFDDCIWEWFSDGK